MKSGKIVNGVFVAGLCKTKRCTNDAVYGELCRRCNNKRKVALGERRKVIAKAQASKRGIPRKWYLYAIAIENELVKFGRATDVRRRWDGLQNASPFELKIIATLACEFDLEQYVHQFLEDEWVRGEWYEYREKSKVVISLMMQDNLLELRKLVQGDQRGISEKQAFYGKKRKPVDKFASYAQYFVPS